MRGQALRYLGWQAADRTGPRVLVAALISSAVFSLIHLASRRQLPPPEIAAQVISQMHSQFALLFALMLGHGIVSEDRHLGYYRFYLAKPVSPLWYYGQHVVLAYLGMLAASTVFLAAGSLALQAAWPWQLLLKATAIFALYGMMIFLFSTVTRRDWLVAGILLIASAIARERYPVGRTVGDILHRVLPPVHLIGWNVSPTAGQWLWIAGWGLGLFAAGLVVLRLRPLGED